MRQDNGQRLLLRTAAPTGDAPVGTSPLQQPAKSVCPACPVPPTLAHHHPSTPLTSLCEFHRTQPIPQRIDEEPESMDFELETSEKHRCAQSDDAPTVEHIEYPYFPSTESLVPKPADLKQCFDEATGSIVESSSAALRRSSSPPSFSPHSRLSSPAPNSPRSERDISPSLSSSPVEHFPSWTQRDLRAFSPVSAPPPFHSSPIPLRRYHPYSH